jgi:hypothetical protein
LISLITALVSATTAIIVAYIGKKKKIEKDIEVLDKLSLKLKEDVINKYEICKLFEFVTGMKLKYNDIVEILKEEDAINIIPLLQKAPGFIKYENGQVKATKNFNNKKIRIAFEMTAIVLFLFSCLVAIYATYLLTVVERLSQKGILSFAIFIFMFIAFFLVDTLSQTKQIKKYAEEIS